MDATTVLLFCSVVAIFIGLGFYCWAYIAAQVGTKTGWAEKVIYGPINPAVVCPHCAARGRVHIKRVERKHGISGGKATAAVLTGGVSLLATGLSRKQRVNQGFCEACRVRWDF